MKGEDNMTIELYKNYGVLSAEKRTIYTYGNKSEQADFSEKIEVKIPDGWEVEKNETDIVITAPWGWVYTPNELLYDNDGAPCFLGTDKDGRFFNIELGEERGDKNGN
ncbi:hypothetical protein ANACAC_00696 [Anaerostipes caccae L1-92]|uniref:Uncharacterized protein n=2 Tax=Anaerostipes caccae TaxID=105841 RepID=B0MAX0_ANACD|nr:hypothetical protein ANACAC_00696 [Anaerostipes caccae L1-92]